MMIFFFCVPCILRVQMFSEANFEGLFKFGVGSKRGDPTQTGRFGLGFNAVYHVTECPQLVTGDSLLILDPQRRCIQPHC